MLSFRFFFLRPVLNCLYLSLPLFPTGVPLMTEAHSLVLEHGRAPGPEPRVHHPHFVLLSALRDRRHVLVVERPVVHGRVLGKPVEWGID